VLILRRRVDQAIKIGDDIEIRIVSIGEEQVRLGITAPRDVPVHRLEVYRRIEEDAAKGHDAERT
jgi:carbon storage regulator